MKTNDRINELIEILKVLNEVMDQITWCQLKIVDYSKPLRDQLEVLIRTRKEEK